MKLKSKCCKSYKKDGKACKRCPKVHGRGQAGRLKLIPKIKKKRARERFVERYVPELIGLEQSPPQR